MCVRFTPTGKGMIKKGDFRYPTFGGRLNYHTDYCKKGLVILFFRTPDYFKQQI